MWPSMIGGNPLVIVLNLRFLQILNLKQNLEIFELYLELLPYDNHCEFPQVTDDADLIL